MLFRSEEHFFALDIAFSEGRLSHAFELISSLFHSGKDLSHFMSQLINHYRLIAICKTLGEQELPSPLASRYMQSSRLYTQQQSLYLLEYLITAEAGLQKSLSPRIYLESTLLHIIRSKNRIPIEVLVRRLSELGSAAPKEEARPIVQKESPPAPSPVVKKESPSAPSRVVQKESLPAPSRVVQKENPPASMPVAETPSKHPSHYDTLIRFAAVELEGSLKTQ